MCVQDFLSHCIWGLSVFTPGRRDKALLLLEACCPHQVNPLGLKVHGDVKQWLFIMGVDSRGMLRECAAKWWGRSKSLPTWPSGGMPCPLETCASMRQAVLVDESATYCCRTTGSIRPGTGFISQLHAQHLGQHPAQSRYWNVCWGNKCSLSFGRALACVKDVSVNLIGDSAWRGGECNVTALL